MESTRGVSVIINAVIIEVLDVKRLRRFLKVPKLVRCPGFGIFLILQLIIGSDTWNGPVSKHHADGVEELLTL